MQFALLCLLATRAQSATVLVGGDVLIDDQIPMYNTTFWLVNTNTGNSRKVAEVAQRNAGSSSVGVVCGTTYHYRWSQQTGRTSHIYGIGALDLVKGGFSEFETPQPYLSLACDPEHDGLLGMVDVYEGDHPWESTPILALKRIDPALHLETVIAKYPYTTDMYDGTYFTQDGSEVWAVWQTEQWGSQPWYVQIMNTSSGEVKTSSELIFSSDSQKSLFEVFPDFKRGIFFTKFLAPAAFPDWGDLKWADLNVADGGIKANIGSADASGLRWSSECSVCGSRLFALDDTSETQTDNWVLNEISPSDGVVINTMNLRSTLGKAEMNLATLACVLPSTEDLALV